MYINTQDPFQIPAVYLIWGWETHSVCSACCPGHRCTGLCWARRTGTGWWIGHTPSWTHCAWTSVHKIGGLEVLWSRCYSASPSVTGGYRSSSSTRWLYPAPWPLPQCQSCGSMDSWWPNHCLWAEQYKQQYDYIHMYIKYYTGING